MEKVRAVRIMCDWCAEGVWSAPSIPNSSMAGFRVSGALWQRLQTWQEWYHQQPIDRALCEWGDFDIAAFVTEGRQIAQAIKRELPEWIVIYHDAERCDEAAIQRLPDSHYLWAIE